LTEKADGLCWFEPRNTQKTQKGELLLGSAGLNR